MANTLRIYPIGSLGATAFAGDILVAELFYTDKGPTPSWDWHFTKAAPDVRKGSSSSYDQAITDVAKAWGDMNKEKRH